MLEYDELKLFFGEDYLVNEHITIRQATIGDIVAYGEKEYFSLIHTLCSVPSDMKSILWDMYNIDWNKLSDFDFFIMMTRDMDSDTLSIIFKGTDLASLIPKINPITEHYALYNESDEIVIDELIYEDMIGYIRKMHGITKKIERARDRFTKDIMLDEDRNKLQEGKGKPYTSQLKSLICTMLVYDGFKYTKKDLKECGIYEFMDAVQRAQIYVSTTALLGGMYSGTVDTSKINKEEFNWFRDPS